MSAKRIVKAIKNYSSFLITSHIDAEGDALGSELALVSLLRKLGKTAFILNRDKASSNYSFLPGVKNISQRLNKRNYQAVFIIDCPEKHRIGSVLKLIDQTKPVINIDHHMDNNQFGRINWVDSNASSTGEMIYQLFRLTQTKLDKKDALNIYTAMLTDTGSFRHANTTPATHLIVSELLKFGLEPTKIYAKIYENNSVASVLLIAQLISRMSVSANHKIVSVKINKEIFKKIKSRHEILDEILDFMRSIKTAKVIIVFCQLQDQLIKVSLRSKSPINIQKVAKSFGGGGHKFASGCSIKGGLKEAEHLLLKEVKRLIAE